jgi:hypothetical protein
MAQAQALGNDTFKELTDFNGNPHGNPTGGLIQDSAGNLYGTNGDGEASGYGSVFKVSPSGTQTTIYSFCAKGSPCVDGGYPASTLLADSSGNLYGTANFGGSARAGVVFELSPAPSGGTCPTGTYQGTGWCETVLYALTGGADGSGPLAMLIMDSAGNLYSTTEGSGIDSIGTTACKYGSVFELSPPASSGGAWTEHTLYDFAGGTKDGSVPVGGLALDSSGNLYGTLSYTGAYGKGAVFELTAGSTYPWMETLLYSFGAVANDGANPASDLIFIGGNLYGTTPMGGKSRTGTTNNGTVFELSPPSSGTTWTETQIYVFTGGKDGCNPYAGVTADSLGNLYGATSACGTSGSWGSVYEISPPASGTTWNETTLYDFLGDSDKPVDADGGNPLGIVSIDSSGNLYGTSSCENCSTLYGSVWELIRPTLSIALSPSANPSTYGQSVTFTATLTATSGTPTGTVTFYNGSAMLGTATLSGGVATYLASSFASLPTGSYTITMSYSGDSTFEPVPQSQSPILTQTVIPANQTITCTGFPTSAAYGSSFTPSCTGGASGNPLSYGAGGVCSVNAGTYTMTSGTGTCYPSISQAGNANYNGAPSPNDPVTATLAASTAAVSSNLTPSIYGQAVTFTANVTSTVTSGATPAGSVQFNIDGANYGSVVTMSSGAAALTTTTLAVGNHTVVAAYSGDTNYGVSSGTLSGGQTVTSATASLTVTSGQNPSVAQQPVTFTATINGEYGLVKRRNGVKPQDVTGTVAWSATDSNSNPVTIGCGSTTVSYTPGTGVGTATCTVSTFASGSYTITAAYTSGDTNHNSGATGTYTQTVNANASITTLVSSLNPSVYGQAVNFTATVTAGATGSVQFNSDGVALGSPVPLNSGTATSGNVTALAAGTHSITAVYSGDSNYAASTGTVHQSVTQAGEGVTITSNLYPSGYGQAVTFTATITANNGLFKRRNGVKPQDVTGSVTWSTNTGCGSTAVTSTPGTGTGTATCTTNVLPVGNDAVTAAYSGDNNHNGGTIGSFSQEVTAAGSGVSVVSDESPSNYGQPVTFTATITAANGLLKRRNGAKPEDVTGSVTWSATYSNGTSATVGCGPTRVTSTPVTYTSAGVGTATCDLNGLQGGTDVVTASYSGDSNHSPESGTVSQVVNPISESITVSTAPPATAAYGSSFTVVASATSELPVTFGVASGSDCSVLNQTPTSALYTVGSRRNTTCTVTVAQAGNNDYLAVPATSVTPSTSLLTPATRKVIFTSTQPASVSYQSTFTVAAALQNTGQADATLPTIQLTGPCQVSGSPTTTTGTLFATILMTSGTGTCTVEPTWALDNVYAQATAKATVKAAKLIPTISWTPAAITYGTPLGSGQLNAVATGYNGYSFTDATYTYNETAGKVLNAGTQSLKVAFKPSATDALNYTDATDTVSLTVSQASTTTTINSTSTGSTTATAHHLTVDFSVVSNLTPTSGTISGTVTVTDSVSGRTCTATVAAGHCTISFTTAGSASLTAAYTGTTNNGGSSSAPTTASY